MKCHVMLDGIGYVWPIKICEKPVKRSAGDDKAPRRHYYGTCSSYTSRPILLRVCKVSCVIEDPIRFLIRKCSPLY